MVSGPRNSVEDVATQPFRRLRMVEVVGGIVDHTDPFHDAARTVILRHRERNDLVKAAIAEGPGNDRARAFGGVAAAPMIRGEPPADLDRR